WTSGLHPAQRSTPVPAAHWGNQHHLSASTTPARWILKFAEVDQGTAPSVVCPWNRRGYREARQKTSTQFPCTPRGHTTDLVIVRSVACPWSQRRLRREIPMNMRSEN